MSHSDCDSEGFESAEEDEFESSKPTAKSAADTKSSKTVDSSEAPSSKSSETTKENITFDKLKVSDEKEEENQNDDWGWGDDDEDNDNFKFESKPNVSEASARVTERPNDLNRDVAQSSQPSSGGDGIMSSQPETPSAWSPWSGMVSLLSTASTGVASFTSHVSSVIESNIGIPDAEQFAQQQQTEKSEIGSQKSDESPSSHTKSVESKQPTEETLLNLGSFVSNVTSISNRVISGGLDTLEGIGKKTMTILQENDAGLISKRKLLGLDNEKPVLSQVLREAKEKSEESEKTMKLTQKKLYKKQLHFETLFDDYHGLVHLEALEMLSKQASLKLQALLMPLSGIALTELQQTMNSVNELCELNELDQDDSPTQLYDVSELEDKFKTATEDFDIPMDFTDILE